MRVRTYFASFSQRHSAASPPPPNKCGSQLRHTFLHIPHPPPFMRRRGNKILIRTPSRFPSTAAARKTDDEKTAPLKDPRSAPCGTLDLGGRKRGGEEKVFVDVRTLLPLPTFIYPYPPLFSFIFLWEEISSSTSSSSTHFTREASSSSSSSSEKA